MKVVFIEKELSLDEVGALLRNPMSLTDGTDKLLADFIWRYKLHVIASLCDNMQKALDGRQETKLCLPSDHGTCFVVFDPNGGALPGDALRKLLDDCRPVVGVEPTHRCKFDSAHQDKPLCPLAYRLCHSPCDLAVAQARGDIFPFRINTPEGFYMDGQFFPSPFP
jgi:hypothetical protein